jgi:hypothetical protein
MFQLIQCAIFFNIFLIFLVGQKTTECRRYPNFSSSYPDRSFFLLGSGWTFQNVQSLISHRLTIRFTISSTKVSLTILSDVHPSSDIAVVLRLGPLFNRCTPGMPVVSLQASLFSGFLLQLCPCLDSYNYVLCTPQRWQGGQPLLGPTIFLGPLLSLVATPYN